jgi:hypothetical protein
MQTPEQNRHKAEVALQRAARLRWRPRSSLASARGAQFELTKWPAPRASERCASSSAHVKAAAEKARAFSPDLIAALQAFGDRALAEKMAESMAPLAILGGESVSDVLEPAAARDAAGAAAERAARGGLSAGPARSQRAAGRGGGRRSRPA